LPRLRTSSFRTTWTRLGMEPGGGRYRCDRPRYDVAWSEKF